MRIVAAPALDPGPTISGRNTRAMRHADRLSFLIPAGVAGHDISWLLFPLSGHLTCETHEAPKRRIVVVRQPHSAERDYRVIAGNGAEHYLRKLCRHRRLGGEAHTQAKRHEVYQDFAADIEPLNTRTGAQLCHVPDQLVVESAAQLRTAQDELLAAEGIPSDFVTIT